jgi:hypothetical protein
MTSNTFLLLLTLAAAVLALWIDQRFPNLGPSSLANAILAVIVSGVALHLSLPLSAALIRMASLSSAMLGVLGVTLPMLALSFLATIWVLKVTIRLLGGTLR